MEKRFINVICWAHCFNGGDSQQRRGLYTLQKAIIHKPLSSLHTAFERTRRTPAKFSVWTSTTTDGRCIKIYSRRCFFETFHSPWVRWRTVWLMLSSAESDGTCKYHSGRAVNSAANIPLRGDLEKSFGTQLRCADFADLRLTQAYDRRRCAAQTLSSGCHQVRLSQTAVCNGWITRQPRCAMTSASPNRSFVGHCYDDSASLASRAGPSCRRAAPRRAVPPVWRKSC